MDTSKGVVLLGGEWAQSSMLLPRLGRHVYRAALEAGWEIPGVRCTRWCSHLNYDCTSRCSSFCEANRERITVEFSLNSPTDLHTEAYGVWTDGRWDYGHHYQVDWVPQSIKYRELRRLAKLPPGRYEMTDGLWLS